jgi:hypothetical protein
MKSESENCTQRTWGQNRRTGWSAIIGTVCTYTCSQVPGFSRGKLRHTRLIPELSATRPFQLGSRPSRSFRLRSNASAQYAPLLQIRHSLYCSAIQFTATGAFDDGSTVDVTSTAAWSSSNPGVVTVDSKGFATYASPTRQGLVNITATGQHEGDSRNKNLVRTRRTHPVKAEIPRSSKGSARLGRGRAPPRTGKNKRNFFCTRLI